MLFVDSSFYIIPAWFGFIGLSVGTVIGFVLLGLGLFLFGINIPIILYAFAAIAVIFASWATAIFWVIVLFGPLILFIASLFLLIPWLMWLSLPNSDKDKSFLDYLKNVYSTEVINSDNTCVLGDTNCDSNY